MMQEPINKPDFKNIPNRLPILPLRDVVIFPHMIFPVLVGRESSLKAANEANERGKFIFLSAQKSPGTDEPGPKDIYPEGTIAKIIQLLKLPNGLMKILVDGIVHAVIEEFVPNNNFLEAKVRIIEPTHDVSTELDALVRHSSTLFSEYIHLNRNIPSEVLVAYENIKDPVRKLYYVAANINQNVETKQKILQHVHLKEQYFELIRILNSEIDILKIGRDIDSKVHDNIQKTQKKYFIQEQIRILQDELGEEETSPELIKLKQQIEEARMPKEIMEKATEEFNKLRKTPPQSPE
ncbi:MAG: LON peptidase substrate-binding domain-containing protein, partial [Bacteroidetes bacterium]|nr:LON peptidase substrate-binding domain-containing protein [Bacteroidota bacterium]